MGRGDAGINPQKPGGDARLQNRRSGSPGSGGSERPVGWAELVSHARSDGERARAQSVRADAGAVRREKRGRAVAPMIGDRDGSEGGSAAPPGDVKSKLR